MFWVGTAASSAVNAWGFVQNGLESSYGCIRTVLKRLFNIWRSIFFYRRSKFAKFPKIQDVEFSGRRMGVGFDRLGAVPALPTATEFAAAE